MRLPLFSSFSFTQGYLSFVSLVLVSSCLVSCRLEPPSDNTRNWTLKNTIHRRPWFFSVRAATLLFKKSDNKNKGDKTSVAVVYSKKGYI
jgi:hypothetical protein